jgi:hypothetical protein
VGGELVEFVAISLVTNWRRLVDFLRAGFYNTEPERRATKTLNSICLEVALDSSLTKRLTLNSLAYSRQLTNQTKSLGSFVLSELCFAFN